LFVSFVFLVFVSVLFVFSHKKKCIFLKVLGYRLTNLRLVCGDLGKIHKIGIVLTP
jgi:hypothetical protein